MKVKVNDVELILTDEELTNLSAVIDTIKKIKMGFTVIDMETIAGYDIEDYKEVCTFLDNVFRRARRER